MENLVSKGEAILIVGKDCVLLISEIIHAERNGEACIFYIPTNTGVKQTQIILDQVRVRQTKGKRDTGERAFCNNIITYTGYVVGVGAPF